MQATVYPGAGSVSAHTVTLGALEGCQLYGGPTPYLYPGAQPAQVATGYSWTLGTVLSCALSVPLSDVSEAQVEKQGSSGGFEAPLSSADLSDTGQFHDPNAPGALPIVSADGSQVQNTYVRPTRGNGDRNAGDEIVTADPIDILVFEHGSVLTVTPYKRPLRQTRTALTVALSARVRTAGGSGVPASALRWSWTFSDGTSSTAATPTHTFAPGVWPVSVQVSDDPAGTGGVGALDITFNPNGKSGSGPGTGAGPHSHNLAPSGPVKSQGNHPGQRAGRPSASTTHAPHSGAKPATSTSAAPARTSRRATTGTRAQASSTHPRTPHQPTPPALAGPLVSGRLISDVTSTTVLPATPVLLADADATAPPVRSAGSPSPLAAIVGGLAVILLFGGGAAREWSARTGFRLLALRRRS